jgi:hypothetical protein
MDLCLESVQGMRQYLLYPNLNIVTFNVSVFEISDPLHVFAYL